MKRAASGRRKKAKAPRKPPPPGREKSVVPGTAAVQGPPVVERPLIVGIGASAGGLEAFEEFFRAQRPDGGCAFVLVPHLAPDHASLLSEILQRTTTMPVVEVQDQMPVVVNRVHVVPPNRDIAIFGGMLQLSPPALPRGQRLPIDSFFRSLAEEQGEAAIGVILSGTGSDGTLGLRAILGAGGTTLVQDPAGARYDGMPASAIRSGVATFVLPAGQMPARIRDCAEALPKRSDGGEKPADTASLRKMLLQLRSETGHDFSLYKKSTLLRRVQRRRSAVGVESLDEYARYLRESPDEVRVLFKELLINVTSFFRDAESFVLLKKEVLPRLFAGRTPDHVMRVWIAGCSTGEEAYSIAIAFREYMDESRQEQRVQVYATDIDACAVATARAGLYLPNIAADVTEERLARFFSKEDAGYRIRRPIRDMIVFAVQDLIKDPPFTKLDLVSCRNVLIYLQPALQERIIPSFHYALRAGGVLWLSSAESIGSNVDLFAVIDRRCKFFRARATTRRPLALRPVGLAWSDRSRGPGPIEPSARDKDLNIVDLTRRELLRSFAPPSVVTDREGNILYVHGDTGRYLRPAPGQASLNAVAMAREGLQTELRGALQVAARGRPVTRRAIAVRARGAVHHLDLTVRPLGALAKELPRLLIASFEEARVSPPRRSRESASRPASARRLGQLEQALAQTQETLRATTEDQQASNEELLSANEELQSANEELQSTNEELETSKEELQSLNEEMVTVNAELQAKIDDLASAQNDLKNLLDSTSIGTVFLDVRLAIRRFSREATAVFRLVPSDVGRPLAHIKSGLEGQDVVEDARAVLESLVPRERQVRAGQRTYLLRVLPYRTSENVIDGVVLTFTDVSELKRVEEAAHEARRYAESIVNAVRDPLVILDARLAVVSVGRSFCEAFLATPAELVGRNLFELGGGGWDDPVLRSRLETVLAEGTGFESLEIEIDIAGSGRRRLTVDARPVPGDGSHERLILLAITDAAGEPLGAGRGERERTS